MPLLARLPYETIFANVYAALKLNLCLVLACSPVLAALAMSQNPLQAWPFYTLLASLCAPAAAAAFATFTGASFWAAYRQRFWRSLGIGATASAIFVILGIDLLLTAATPFAAVAPMLAVLGGLVAVVATHLLAAGETKVLTMAYLSVRKWYLSLANLAALLTVAAAVTVKPAVGLFLVPAPALYLVWANARHMALTNHSPERKGDG